MDARLVALKLVLDELHEPDTISSVSDRLRLQKAIYLTQVAGLNLGYSYSWYLKGPYSTSLTRDYYELAEGTAGGDADYRNYHLNSAVKESLGKVSDLLQKPQQVNLSTPNWYELLASLHYLMTTGRHSYQDACEVLRKTKPHLLEYFEQGRDQLQRFGLV